MISMRMCRWKGKGTRPAWRRCPQRYTSPSAMGGLWVGRAPEGGGTTLTGACNIGNCSVGRSCTAHRASRGVCQGAHTRIGGSYARHQVNQLRSRDSHMMKHMMHDSHAPPLLGTPQHHLRQQASVSDVAAPLAATSDEPQHQTAACAIANASPE